MPEPRSTSVPGSGTKFRVRMPKAGSTAEAPMFVLMKIGVTSCTLPPATAPPPDVPPITVSAPTAAVPVVHGAPTTVRLTSADTVVVPPAPTTDSGTDTLAGGGAAHGANRHTFAWPRIGIGPARLKLPAPFWAVTCTPRI